MNIGSAVCMHGKLRISVSKRGYLLGSNSADIEVAKRQLNDFVRLTDEGVKQTIDIRRIWLRVIRGCKCATLRSVRAAVDNARATYNRHNTSSCRRDIIISNNTRSRKHANNVETYHIRES